MMTPEERRARLDAARMRTAKACHDGNFELLADAVFHILDVQEADGETRSRPVGLYNDDGSYTPPSDPREPPISVRAVVNLARAYRYPESGTSLATPTPTVAPQPEPGASAPLSVKPSADEALRDRRFAHMTPIARAMRMAVTTAVNSYTPSESEYKNALDEAEKEYRRLTGRSIYDAP